ncbi:hypothetical protein DM01DRAFT_1339199 [Hesseltinella vesiculosa]|uniref:Uncharacterized protein n=1 Tax=Hesseltinella vesiculosa TaxID=101127 RepID=A0A1X2G7N9_9FUNG|nr:hypothetical protein DM01DRAFT_1339199 [Hesseltinella vesiculosa]
MVFDYATEKKLRPLYDAIDDGQYKLAMQLANRYLKKSPNWALVKALKAVVLIRTGKDDEAKELCIEVKKAIPADQDTLQAVTIAFKELGEFKQIVELYANLFNLQPKNEDLGVQWFMAMVRNADYKGQQLAAIKLQRIFKKDKYFFWSVMSLALQGQDGNDLAYVLAERMMAKAQEENRLVEVEHMRLYLLVMMDQGKHDQALALLDTPLGQKALRDPEVAQIKIELQLKNALWLDALTACELAIRENVDDWISWLAYFDAVDGLLASQPDIVHQVHDFIQAIQNTDGASVNRGPFLAQLEFDRRASIQQQDVLDHCKAYFERFSAKSCCFEDLKPYVSFLDPASAAVFVDALAATIKPAKEKSAQVKNVYRSINVHKLKRFLRSNVDQDQLAYVDTLWQHYQEALPLGEDLEKTEFQYGDDFVLLAGHVLFSLFEKTNDWVHVLRAITLLEVALQKSIYNFQIKLLLVRLYLVLGAPTRAWALYKTMDIKQIQFDTMLHYFTDRWVPVAQHIDLDLYLQQGLSIYKSNDIETPDMQVQAYKLGTFSKIQEFIEFRQRLEKSLQHAVSKIDMIRIEALGSSFQAKYAVQFFHDLDLGLLKLQDDYAPVTRFDNRDFKVMTNSHASDQRTAQECIKPAPSTNATWVHVFSLMLNVIHTATKSDDAQFKALVQALQSYVSDNALDDKMTPEEVAMIKHVLAVAQALMLIKDKDNEKAQTHLTLAMQLLDAQSKAVTEDQVGWAGFQAVYSVLESFNYGVVLLELMARQLGLTSKDARRKATDSDSDPLAHAVMLAHGQYKAVLVHLQDVCKAKAACGKTLSKKWTQGSDLQALKEKTCQSVLEKTVKSTVTSWQKSLDALLDEVNRRIQKFQ